MNLRPYQVESVDSLRDNLRRGVRRQILTGPTGMGKTECALAVISEAEKKGSRVAFVCDRQSLVAQTSARMLSAGIRHGVLMGKETFGIHEPIRVCSAQTIESRGMHEVDLVIIDECHEVRENLLKMVKRFDIPTIGMTATPFPSKLANWYDDMVVCTTTSKLIADGYLAPLKVVAPTSVVDVEGLAPSAGGEWRRKDIGKRVLRIVGDIVPEWERQLERHFDGEPQPTIAFAASIDDAEMLTERFRQAGYDFQVVSSRTPDDNVRILEDFRRHKFMGVVNCAVLTRGFDAPDTRILIDAYPLRKSLVTHIQKLGRVMRAAPRKEFGLLIDHTEDWLAFRDETIAFYENGPPPLGDETAGKAERKPFDRPRSICRECRTVFQRGDTGCQTCGADRPKPTPSSQLGKYAVVKGKLEMVDEIAGQTTTYTPEHLWREICTSVATGKASEERAHRRAKATYRSITGKWPPARRFEPYDKKADPVIADLVRRNFQAWVIAQKYKEKVMK